MSILIDTNIAIYIRDDEPSIMARLASLAVPPQLSVVTRVELEGGSAGISSSPGDDALGWMSYWNHSKCMISIALVLPSIERSSNVAGIPAAAC